MDYSLPGSFLHGILQARVLEWVAISFTRGSSQLRDRTGVSRITGRRFNLWAIREAHLLLKSTLIQFNPVSNLKSLTQSSHHFNLQLNGSPDQLNSLQTTLQPDSSLTHLPNGSGDKESTCNAGDTWGVASISGLRRSPGEGYGNPLQYSCLENFTDRGAWWATVHEVAKNQPQLSMHVNPQSYLYQKAQLIKTSDGKMPWVRKKPDLKRASVDRQRRGTSLVVQWLRICLAMQATWVLSLVWENSIWLGTAKPMHPNYWSHALTP